SGPRPITSSPELGMVTVNERSPSMHSTCSERGRAAAPGGPASDATGSAVLVTPPCGSPELMNSYYPPAVGEGKPPGAPWIATRRRSRFGHPRGDSSRSARSPTARSTRSRLLMARFDGDAGPGGPARASRSAVRLADRAGVYGALSRLD